MFNFKEKITGQSADNGTKNIEIMVPLKYFSNFWKNTEMPLISFKVSVILTWPANYVIVSTSAANHGSISDTKLYVIIEILSTQENVKLIDPLKSGFKVTINRN